MNAITSAADKIRSSQSTALAEIRNEMRDLSFGATRCPVNMTPAKIRAAGIPGKLGCDQLAKTYGLRPYGGAGGYWSYVRA